MNHMTQNKMEGVAPLAGAWIEIIHMLDDGKPVKVAPLAGAWIEISKRL